MNLTQYFRWRERFLSGKEPCRPLSTPRGDCQVGEQLYISDHVCPGWHLDNRALEDAEFNLIFTGTDMSPEWRAKLYGNDDDLYNAYKSLKLQTLATNGKRRFSRKNIYFNKECCLCFWQLHGDELYVVSRSLDVQRAGKSDLVLINRVAHDLGCTKWSLTCLCPHVYNDRTHIARRTNETSRI